MVCTPSNGRQQESFTQPQQEQAEGSGHSQGTEVKQQLLQEEVTFEAVTLSLQKQEKVKESEALKVTFSLLQL